MLPVVFETQSEGLPLSSLGISAKRILFLRVSRGQPLHRLDDPFLFPSFLSSFFFGEFHVNNVIAYGHEKWK